MAPHLLDADGGLERVAVGAKLRVGLLGIVHLVLVATQVELVSRLLLGVLALAERVEDGAVLCRIDLEGGPYSPVSYYSTMKAYEDERNQESVFRIITQPVPLVESYARQAPCRTTTSFGAHCVRAL